jgi:hypothetical protein
VKNALDGLEGREGREGRDGLEGRDRQDGPDLLEGQAGPAGAQWVFPKPGPQSNVLALAFAFTVLMLLGGAIATLVFHERAWLIFQRLLN